MRIISFVDSQKLGRGTPVAIVQSQTRVLCVGFQYPNCVKIGKITINLEHSVNTDSIDNYENLFAVGYGSRLTIFDTDKIDSPIECEGIMNYFLCPKFSPDGKKIVAGSRDRECRVFNTSDGQELLCFREHQNFAKYVAFLNNTIGFSADTHFIFKWDVENGTIITKSNSQLGTVFDKFAISPLNDNIALVDMIKNVIFILDSENMQELKKIDIPNIIIDSLVFSPNGVYLAIGSSMNDIILVNTRTGKQIAHLKGHTQRVSSLCFSPSGRCIYSVSRDKTLKMWHLSYIYDKDINLFLCHVHDYLMFPNDPSFMNDFKNRIIRALLIE